MTASDDFGGIKVCWHDVIMFICCRVVFKIRDFGVSWRFALQGRWKFIMCSAGKWRLTWLSSGSTSQLAEMRRVTRCAKRLGWPSQLTYGLKQGPGEDYEPLTGGETTLLNSDRLFTTYELSGPSITTRHI